MLQQCMKVLKPGGKASFSVWGSKSYRNFFEIQDEALALANNTPFLSFSTLARDSNWYLGDRNILISKLKEAGFVDITVTE
jgi:hypothetical protein